MTELLSLAGSDVNERAVAKAALDAAEEQLRSLCAAHASTFVAVERRGQAVQTSLKQLLHNIEASEHQISRAKEALEQEDEQGEGTLAALSEKHRVRRRTLLQHSHLLELLELPSLMDACVRSNLYDDALSIAAFSNTLERRHMEKNTVVLQVIEQIRSRQQDLRRHLLHSLKGYVTMPQCLEIVTSLRRLNSIDLERETECNMERTYEAMELSLQVDFLEARDCWLEKPGNASTSINAFASPTTSHRTSDLAMKSSEQLLDTIERYRTRVFEIATQFNAIFRAQMRQQKTNSISLLSMWTSRKVEAFLSMLAVELEKMKDSAQLRDALDACVFFAASMGRLGADFTAQLPSLFERKMHGIIKQIWKDGVMQMAETLRVCREAKVASPLISSSHIDDINDGTAATGTLNSSTMSSTDGPPPPPRQLMAYPPMARLLNAFLTGMNELRRCLLPGVFKMLRDSMTTALKKSAAILKSNERTLLNLGLSDDVKQLRKVDDEMRTIFHDVLEPYVRCALEFALGNHTQGWDIYNGMKMHADARAAAEAKAQAEKDAAVAKQEEEEEKERAEAAHALKQDGDTPHGPETPPVAEQSEEFATDAQVI